MPKFISGIYVIHLSKVNVFSQFNVHGVKIKTFAVKIFRRFGFTLHETVTYTACTCKKYIVPNWFFISHLLISDHVTDPNLTIFRWNACLGRIRLKSTKAYFSVIFSTDWLIIWWFGYDRRCSDRKRSMKQRRRWRCAWGERWRKENDRN